MDSIEAYKYTKEEISQIFKDDLKNHYLKRENSGLVSVGPVNEYREIKVESENSPKKYEKIKYKFDRTVKTAQAMKEESCQKKAGNTLKHI